MDWVSQDSTEVYNRWRALDELTGVFTAWNGKRLRLLELSRVGDDELDAEAREAGEVVVARKKLYVKCKVCCSWMEGLNRDLNCRLSTNRTGGYGY